ncbi:PRC-barrel domain-containing protein [Oricola cellulosilytica]|uniref:PRC-barrel domain containing protein n=1 Tax=Oricola cellulosilytica TaxID=1429082 RepID=A0A4R0PCV2_9HYPH|nr:PRC-barrel domain-containing protein [Oricola cellulosilytica]TCD15302.1 PRC-barrel domain containing protein [Oricola cellulosilytica]
MKQIRKTEMNSAADTTRAGTSGARTGRVSDRIAAVLATFAILAPLQATAMQIDTRADQAPYVMAYADPSPERFDGRFGGSAAPEQEYFSHEEEHELNDAWLGMTVVSQEGVNIGYVTDAFLDEQGLVESLVVIPGDSNAILGEPVYVPARFAKLGNTAVNLTLTVGALATLEIANEYAQIEE